MNGKELNEELAKLVEISKRYGKKPSYALSGEGSVARKINGVMFVKDADVRLGDLSTADFIHIDRNKLNDALVKDYPADYDKREKAVSSQINGAKLYYNDYRRVGVNALLHNLFDYKFTLHLRPALINVLSQALQGQAGRPIGSDAVWAPAGRDGFGLVLQCRDLLNDYYHRAHKQAKILIVRDNGVYVAGDTPEDLDNQVQRVMSAVESQIEGFPDYALLEHDTRYVRKLMGDIAKCYGKAVYGLFASSKRILKFIAGDAGKDGACNAAAELCCPRKYLPVPETDELNRLFKAFVRDNKRLPDIFCIPGVGAVSVGASKLLCERGMFDFLEYIKATGAA